MTRSIWKLPVIDYTLLKKSTTRQNSNRYKQIKLYSKQSIIIPQFIGLTIDIYNGKEFVSLLIKEQMVGHKLGEFVFTRKKHIYKKKKKKGYGTKKKLK